MDSETFEKGMCELEYFHGLRALPGAWIVIRVDGRSFSRFTKSRFQKPFDLAFHNLMTQTASALVAELHGMYAYTESDEISLLLRPDWDMYDREVEKLVSLSAAIASATFTHAVATPAYFDSRLWLGARDQQVVDYFRWRMADAERCGLNGWCYWTLRNDGLGVAEATGALDGKTVADKNELLFQHGINWNDLPAWQRRGSGVYWETYEKVGFDPLRGERVTAARRRLKMDDELPMKDAYTAFIRELLTSIHQDDEEEV